MSLKNAINFLSSLKSTTSLKMLQTPSKKFKGDSRYTGRSDNEDDDYNNFTMNKCFINYSALDDN